MEVSTHGEVSYDDTPYMHVSRLTPGNDERSLAELFTTVSPHISRLTTADAADFRDAFQQEEPCYANSWLYLLRTTRLDRGERGFKCIAPGARMGIGFRKNTVYVVHPLGPERFTATRDVVRALRARTPYPIVLKKIDQQLSAYLASSSIPVQAMADSSQLFEEEAYPEHILPLPRLYTSDEGLYRPSLPFMRKVRRFANGPIRLEAQTDLSGIEDHPGFSRLFGSNSDKYESYLSLIREVCSPGRGPGRYRACGYVDQDGMLHGLYICERLGELHMGLYCAVSSCCTPGITEWMDHDFFRRVFAEGIAALYLGGSETAGVHAYVQKLLPTEPPYLMRPMYCSNNATLASEGTATSSFEVAVSACGESLRLM